MLDNHSEDWLGALPIGPGENRAAFDRLARELTEALAPSSVIERMWTRDIISAQWDVLRYSAAKSALLKGDRREALRSMLLPLTDLELAFPYDVLGDLLDRYFSGDPDAVTDVRDRLSRHGYALNDVDGRVIEAQLPKIRIIEGLLTLAMHRRDSLIHSIDKRRLTAERRAALARLTAAADDDRG